MTTPFDINKPYTTRDGREAKVIEGPDGRLYGYWLGHGGTHQSGWWGADGSWSVGTDSNDLINVPEKRTVKVWINDYGSGVLSLHRTRGEADNHATTMEADCYPRFACIEREIEYEVGEGL